MRKRKLCYRNSHFVVVVLSTLSGMRRVFKGTGCSVSKKGFKRWSGRSDVNKIERRPKETKTWKIRNTSKPILNQEPKPVVVSLDTSK